MIVSYGLACMNASVLKNIHSRGSEVINKQARHSPSFELYGEELLVCGVGK
jgi:hypothetical protein